MGWPIVKGILQSIDLLQVALTDKLNIEVVNMNSVPGDFVLSFPEPSDTG